MTNYGSGGTVAKVVDNTYQRWMPEWLKNMRDLDRRPGQLSGIRDIPKNDRIETLIICGSGPSLNDDIPILYQLQSHDDVGIIANHSNLATLLYNGITPQFCVITDASDRIPKRLKEIVMPNWKKLLKKTRFLLPTIARSDLVDLFQSNHLMIFFWKSIARPSDQMIDLFNLVVTTFCPSIEDAVLQAGCVSNVSLILAHLLKFYSFSNVTQVILSGVDFSYPRGIARCQTITMKDGILFSEEKPTWIAPDLKLIKYNGLLSDTTSIAYRNDLIFLLENLRVEDNKLPFDIFTSNNNFISDFLNVKTLSSL